jgi:hypothetical protein
MAKVKLKTETIGVRVPPKMRYGLELLARRNEASLSMMMTSAAERLLEAEGLTTKAPGQLVSPLDRLWSEDEVERIKAIVQHGGGLATTQEKFQCALIRGLENSPSLEDFKKNFFAYGGTAQQVQGFSDTALDEIIRRQPWLRDNFKNTPEFMEWLLDEHEKLWAQHYEDEARSYVDKSD